MFPAGLALIRADLEQSGAILFAVPPITISISRSLKTLRSGIAEMRRLGTVEFRAEFFNIFNIVDFGLPSNIVRGSGFGIISKTAGTSRQIQFSLKIIY